MKNDFYIGLLSGTSMDAIDATIVNFSKQPLKIVATHSEPIPAKLKEKLLALCTLKKNTLMNLGVADVELGHLLAQATLNLLKKTTLKTQDIKAIGSHGQTIYHMPNSTYPFTLQIGDPNVIALRTGMTTITDFRRRDIAAGGEGAPLAPAFHAYAFSDPNKKRAILNIGGIANITILNGKEPIGFDTGPGNTLLDAWCKIHTKKEYDNEGSWARSGTTNPELLKKLTQDPYFKKPYPKSTGREYFNLEWLYPFLNGEDPNEIQATLTDLTAQTISDAIRAQDCDEVIVCGGGTRNTLLMEKIKAACKEKNIIPSSKAGIDPDWVEAVAFAWLAKQTMENQPGNLPSVTGAKTKTILGGVYYP